MAKYTVDMIVRARDEATKPLHSIGQAVTNMGSLIRKAVGVAAVYFGAREIKRFVQESLQAFGEQELALTNLVSSLARLGPVTAKAQKDYLNFVEEIQRTTTMADEQVLSVMQLGVTIGKFSGEKLKEATKAAIGLSKGLKIDLETAMRLVAKAAAGNTATMARYGLVLGDNLTAQEKFNKILKFGIDFFPIAEEEAKTYTGRIQQMKNALSEVKEAIGQALMPIFKKWAETITDWAYRNKEAIGTWAQKAVAAVTLVKDIFVSYINFMKIDWVTGFQKSLDAGIRMLKTFGLSVIEVMKMVRQEIAETIIGEKFEPYKIYLQARKIRKELEKEEAFYISGGMTEEAKEAIAKRRESEVYRRLAEWQKERREGQITWESTGKKIAELWSNTLKDIADIMPEFAKSIDEAFARFGDRLSKITTDVFVKPVASGLGEFAEETKKVGDKLVSLPFREAQGLTRWAGAGINYEKETANNTREQIRLTKETNQKLSTLAEHFKSLGFTPAEVRGLQLLPAALS